MHLAGELIEEKVKNRLQVALEPVVTAMHFHRTPSSMSPPSSALAAISHLVVMLENEMDRDGRMVLECIENMRRSLAGVHGVNLTRGDWISLLEMSDRLHDMAICIEGQDLNAAANTKLFMIDVEKAFSSNNAHLTAQEKTDSLVLSSLLHLSVSAIYQKHGLTSKALHCLEDVNQSLGMMRENRRAGTEEQICAIQLEYHCKLFQNFACSDDEGSKSFDILFDIRKVFAQLASTNHSQLKSSQQNIQMVAGICHNFSAQYLLSNPPNLLVARKWAKESEVFFGIAHSEKNGAKHLRTVLLLASCEIKLGISGDREALERAVQYLEFLVDKNHEIHVCKRLLIRSFIQQGRWDSVESFLSGELRAENVMDVEDSKANDMIQLWLHCADMISEGNMCELAISLYQQIFTIAKERGLKWEEVQVHRIVAAHRMRDLNLAALVSDSLRVSSESAKTIPHAGEVIKICNRIVTESESAGELDQAIEWIQRSLRFSEKPSNERSTSLFRLAKIAMKKEDLQLLEQCLAEWDNDTMLENFDHLRRLLIQYKIKMKKGLDGEAALELASGILHELNEASSRKHSIRTLSLVIEEIHATNGDGIRHCFRSMVTKIMKNSESENPVAFKHVDLVMQAYVYSMILDENLILAANICFDEAMSVLLSSLNYIQQNESHAFDDRMEKTESLQFFSDFAWGCAVQKFKSLQGLNEKKEDFKQIAAAFKASADFRFHGLTIERQRGQQGLEMEQCKLNAGNEIVLGYFLSVAAQFLSFKRQMGDFADLKEAKETARMIEKTRKTFAFNSSLPAKLTEMKLVFEVLSSLHNAINSEETSLSELMTCFFDVIVCQPEEALPRSKAVDALVSICRIAHDRNLPAKIRNQLCRKALEVVSEDRIEDMADLLCMLLTAVETASLDQEIIVTSILTTAKKRQSYPSDRLHFASIVSYNAGILHAIRSRNLMGIRSRECFHCCCKGCRVKRCDLLYYIEGGVASDDPIKEVLSGSRCFTTTNAKKSASCSLRVERFSAIF